MLKSFAENGRATSTRVGIVATKTKGISVIPTLVVVALLVGGGYLFSSWNSGESGDDFEIVEAVVSWEPTKRAIPVEITHTMDPEGEGRSNSPWFREFHVKRGLVVSVTARQLEPGNLKCVLVGKSSKQSDIKEIQTAGLVTCTYKAT